MVKIWMHFGEVTVQLEKASLGVTLAVMDRANEINRQNVISDRSAESLTAAWSEPDSDGGAAGELVGGCTHHSCAVTKIALPNDGYDYAITRGDQGQTVLKRIDDQE